MVLSWVLMKGWAMEQDKAQKPLHTYLEARYVTEVPLKVSGKVRDDPINGVRRIYPNEIVSVFCTIYAHTFQMN